jgi:outer membrane receptor for ferrienterochelin and colicins
VYGANIDAKIAHGKEFSLQMGFTAQRSRYKQPEAWTEVDGVALTTKRMMRTPDYYGYFTIMSSPVKRLDLSLSGTYTGSMIVPHYAGYIENDRLETTPDFFDLNFKAGYTFVLHDHINLQLNGGVQNIFNSFQSDLDKGEFRDSGYFYGPTQPRTFFVGVKISQ